MTMGFFTHHSPAANHSCPAAKSRLRVARERRDMDQQRFRGSPRK
jgi:hypothetical protein